MRRDAYVQVERFVDMLPPIISSESTKAFLREHFGPPQEAEQEMVKVDAPRFCSI